MSYGDFTGLHFEVTPDHIKLIRAFYVEWWDCETGAPAINPKRPYGNRYVPGDVADILGWERTEDGELTDEQESLAYEIHGETQTVLQIVLATGSFEPGNYKRPNNYGIEWEHA